MKVSKIIGIVVALHVLVIGGIFFFEGCSRASKNTPDMAANETAPGETPPAAATTDQTQTVAMTPPVALTPPAPVAPAPAAAPATRTHIVKKGETLTRIAKAEGVTIGEISKANKLTKTSVLKVGQKLTIPAKAETTAVAAAPAAPAAPAPTAVAAAAPATVEGTAYTVKSGDSLWKIAKANHSTVAAIKQANNLTGDALKVGQKLTIPAAAPAAVAAAPAASAATPATAPAVAASTAPAVPASTEFLPPGKYSENGQTIHIVDFNESPALIAKKYGIKTDDLMKANNLTDPRKVHYGQRLVIPLPPAAPATVSAETPAAQPVVATTAPAIH